MSIPLPALLGLSHDLYHARKRRHDWELAADGPAAGPSRAACGSAASSCAPHSAEEQVETELLHAALGESGLQPRAPDAEIAMLALLEASLRGGKAARRRTGMFATDFAWMCVVEDAPAPAPAAQSQGDLDILCPEKKPSADSSPDDTLKRLCDIDGASDDGDSSADVFGTPGELLNTEQSNSSPCLAPAAEFDAAEAAVARLAALLRGPLAREDEAAEASDCEECDSGFSESDLEFIEDTSREAILEAEREELAKLLALERCRDVETEFSAKCVVSA
jgi:hypothetical protein